MVSNVNLHPYNEALREALEEEEEQRESLRQRRPRGGASGGPTGAEVTRTGGEIDEHSGVVVLGNNAAGRRVREIVDGFEQQRVTVTVASRETAAPGVPRGGGEERCSLLPGRRGGSGEARTVAGARGAPGSAGEETSALAGELLEELALLLRAGDLDV